MQNQAAMAYQQVAKQTVSPRNREADLLSRSASDLQRVRDNWASSQKELDKALQFNRKLWTILLTSVTRQDNPLPRQLKENVVNLGLFIIKRTLDIQITPTEEKLDAIININRELAAGLRAIPDSK